MSDYTTEDFERLFQREKFADSADGLDAQVAALELLTAYRALRQENERLQVKVDVRNERFHQAQQRCLELQAENERLREECAAPWGKIADLTHDRDKWKAECAGAEAVAAQAITAYRDLAACNEQLAEDNGKWSEHVKRVEDENERLCIDKYEWGVSHADHQETIRLKNEAIAGLQRENEKLRDAGAPYLGGKWVAVTADEYDYYEKLQAENERLHGLVEIYDEAREVGIHWKAKAEWLASRDYGACDFIDSWLDIPATPEVAAARLRAADEAVQISHGMGDMCNMKGEIDGR